MSAKKAQDSSSLIIHIPVTCGNIRTVAGQDAPSADPKDSTFAARFWAKVDRKSDSECWLWTAGTRKDGYGSFNIEGRKQSAHRIAYRLTHGSTPANKVVRHTCDNPPCCNPKHLVLGTPKDNTRDSIERGRHVNPVSPWMRRLIERRKHAA